MPATPVGKTRISSTVAALSLTASESYDNDELQTVSDAVDALIGEFAGNATADQSGAAMTMKGNTQ